MDSAARAMLGDDDFSLFATPMLLLNLVLWLGTGSFAAWLATVISRSRFAPTVVALGCFLYGAYNHFYAVRGRFPDWYNVAVPFAMAASIVLGSRFVKSSISLSHLSLATSTVAALRLAQGHAC
jgi:FAD/FMN-containing dehydrogenase